MLYIKTITTSRKEKTPKPTLICCLESSTKSLQSFLKPFKTTGHVLNVFSFAKLICRQTAGKP